MTPTPHLLHPKYRTDIDGLRAIAVLVVVAFHAFPQWVTGGFIGVDIFFVISGFLISTILYENLAAKQFSFLTFYARRIRRIFPALILVLLTCFGVGWFVLLPDEYAQLGHHMAAGAGFVQNFVLWGEANYFDNLAETKPLLHLWSLGIEEQFYIIWPLLLWLAYRLRANLLVVTLLIGGVSFFLNIEGIKGNATATFYSPQTRFWELLAGATLAYVNLSGLRFANSPVKPQGLSRWSNGAATLGMALLILGLVLIHKKSLFPGWWALLPVLGTILILWAGPKAWFNRTVLSNRVLVWIGLISYPLYLWHWALLSFARIMESETPNEWVRLGLVLSSVGLAALTYYWLEKPIRFGKYPTAKTIALIILMSIIGYLGYNTYQRDGLGFRYAKYNFSQYNEELRTTEIIGRGFAKEIEEQCDFSLHQTIAKSCYSKNLRYPHQVLLWGDSTAAMLTYGLINNLPDDYELQTIFESGCPLFDLKKTTPGGNDYCTPATLFAKKIMSSNKPELVIVSFRTTWSKERFKAITDELHALGVRNIIFVGKSVEWEIGLPSFVFRKMRRPIAQRSLLGFNAQEIEHNKALQAEFKLKNAEFLNTSSIFCDQQGCLVYLGDSLEKGITSLDRFHLSAVAADYFAKTLLVPQIISMSGP